MGIHAGIYMAAAILSTPVLTAGGGQNTAAATNVSFEAPQESGSGEAGTAAASRFVLPEEARVLVIVEGTGGSGCNVYAFERSSAAGSWEKRVETTGYLGMNGMIVLADTMV